MGFDQALNSTATALALAGVIAAIRMLSTLSTRVAVIESHNVNTEEMRAIIKDTQAPLLAEVHHLREEVEAMRVQIAGRRTTDA